MAKKRRKKAGAGSWSGGPAVGGSAGGMGNLMSQMTKVQEEMDKIQAALDEEELTVTAGGGMITVVITGGQEFRSIKIDPDAVDPEDVEMLEDMVLAAVSEAMQTSKAVQEERMGALTSGMGLPPGLGI
jgi:DNA-binding YbaB/EbfC family protein